MKKPGLIEFVQVLEKESIAQAHRLDDVKKSKCGKPTKYKSVNLDKIPPDYINFKQHIVEVVCRNVSPSHAKEASEERTITKFKRHKPKSIRKSSCWWPYISVVVQFNQYLVAYFSLV